MNKEQSQNNTPTFTPPASVTAGSNTPAIGTTDSELNAMYGEDKAAPSVKETEVKVSADDKKSKDETVGGYKDESAKEAAGYKESEAKPDTKDNKADADSKEAFKVEFDKTGYSEQAVKMIEGFAEANKLTKEQVSGFAGFVKSIQDAQAQAKTQAEANAKAAATKDFQTLKEDKDFGGENLDTSFKQVGQVLDLMPEVKKYLTETGSRLQPQVMMGLKRLHGKLFGQDGTIVQGGANKSASTSEPWNEFYG
jgi:hypothetical protein